MSRNRPSPPVLARPAATSVSRKSSRAAAPGGSAKALLPSKARPEDVFARLRCLIEEDQISRARKLTIEAARRFPDHEEIRLAKRILADGRATPNPYAQPTATAEIQWLEDPPEEARGKWVALIGDLVGVADSVEELKQSLDSRKFEQFPLVQYVAP